MSPHKCLMSQLDAETELGMPRQECIGIAVYKQINVRPKKKPFCKDCEIDVKPSMGESS